MRANDLLALTLAVAFQINVANAENGVVTVDRINGTDIFNVRIVDTDTGASRTLITFNGATTNGIIARAHYNPVKNTVAIDRLVDDATPAQASYVDTYDVASGALLSTVQLSSSGALLSFSESSIYQLPDQSQQITDLNGNVSNAVIGAGASAAFDNSAAFGKGATATRPNQQVFGTSSNTYTMPGITSNASRAAQGAPSYIVTSNGSGDLAAYTPSELGLATEAQVAGLQSQIHRLGSRDEELTEGIATVASLAQPVLLSGQHFAMRAGWGGFDDANAVSFTAAGVLAENVLRPGRGSVVLDGGVGVGTAQGGVAGRAGLSFGW